MLASQLAALVTGSPVSISISDNITDQLKTPEAPEVREYTIPELITEISGHYDVDSTLALDIARCESHLQQFHQDGSLVRGRKNSRDVGVFQINEEYHLERSRALGFDIYTSTGNIGYAMWLMDRNGNRDWHWSQDCWG